MEFLLISLTRASPYYQANEALPFNRSYQYELLVANLTNYCPGKMYDDFLECDNMTYFRHWEAGSAIGRIVNA